MLVAEQLDILPKLGVSVGKMQRFILGVRERMLDNPYHNWTHIFDVTQVRECPAIRDGGGWREAVGEGGRLWGKTGGHGGRRRSVVTEWP